MEPNVIKMYQERFTEFLHVLKNDIYPESVPFRQGFHVRIIRFPGQNVWILNTKRSKKGKSGRKNGKVHGSIFLLKFRKNLRIKNCACEFIPEAKPFCLMMTEIPFLRSQVIRFSIPIFIGIG